MGRIAEVETLKSLFGVDGLPLYDLVGESKQEDNFLLVIFVFTH